VEVAQSADPHRQLANGWKTKKSPYASGCVTAAAEHGRGAIAPDPLWRGELLKKRGYSDLNALDQNLSGQPDAIQQAERKKSLASAIGSGS
jgi:hypothetical protein